MGKEARAKAETEAKAAEEKAAEPTEAETKAVEEKAAAPAEAEAKAAEEKAKAEAEAEAKAEANYSLLIAQRDALVALGNPVLGAAIDALNAAITAVDIDRWIDKLPHPPGGSEITVTYDGEKWSRMSSTTSSRNNWTDAAEARLSELKKNGQTSAKCADVLRAEFPNDLGGVTAGHVNSKWQTLK